MRVSGEGNSGLRGVGDCRASGLRLGALGFGPTRFKRDVVKVMRLNYLGFWVL